MGLHRRNEDWLERRNRRNGPGEPDKRWNEVEWEYDKENREREQRTYRRKREKEQHILK